MYLWGINVNQKRKINMTDFFLYLNKLNKQTLCARLNRIDKLTLKNNSFILCGGPCHLFSLSKCSVTVFSPENSVLIHLCGKRILSLYYYLINIVNLKNPTLYFVS